jgi:hypothetical protein
MCPSLNDYSYPWTDDEILTWISIYWFSQAGPAASLRIYYEATHTSAEANRERVQHWIGKVKLGLCYAPKVCDLPFPFAIMCIVFDRFALFRLVYTLFSELLIKSNPSWNVTHTAHGA